MENATKALLIAAAVLIAILIISLGIVVYQTSAETVGKINMSGQEITANNEKFTRYNGAHKRGSDVNAMLKTVLNANLEAHASGEDARRVEVTGDVVLAVDATAITAQADTSTLYTIVVNFDADTGLVNTINVDAE